MKTIEQKPGETKLAYLRKARRYAAKRFRFLRQNDPENQYCHESHTVAQALQETEARYPDLGTFGFEGDCELNGEGHIDIQYLNTGDSYGLTILHWKGRFIVGTWGDIVENIPESC